MGWRWALSPRRELGGQGLPCFVSEPVYEGCGRSCWVTQSLGTLSLQDSLMVHQDGGALWRERYLLPMIAGDFVPNFAMTEPDISNSDPTQLQTRAHLEDGHWPLDGHKW